MKILAIDTSSFPASVAIADNGILMGEYVIRNQRKHSQNIMMMTERLFDDLGMDISEIDVFSVTFSNINLRIPFIASLISSDICT